MYLWNKYKGKYRVLPELDKITKDLPRNYDGTIDPTFDDYYIPGYKGMRIKHSEKSILTCYVPGIRLMINILLKIYEYEHKKPCNISNNSEILSILIEENIIEEGEILDGEGYFLFKAPKLEEWEAIFKLKTHGANIHPHSKKNLPKSDIKLPDKALKEYQEIIQMEQYPAQTLECTLHLRKLRELNREFAAKNDMDLTTLKAQHQTRDSKLIFWLEGQWESYLSYLSENI